MDEISVVVVDDHDILAQSLAMVLDAEDDLAVAGIALTMSAAADLVGRMQPDVVLLDANLGDEDGIAGIPRLLSLHPLVRIVVLSGSRSDQVLLSAVEAGAAGFVPKARGVQEVVAAVRAAAADEAALSPAVLGRLLPLMRSRAVGGGDLLSEREVQVLRLVARGLTNAAIADELHLSVNTVRNHVAALSSKLGAHSKLEALSVALRRGLVDPP